MALQASRSVPTSLSLDTYSIWQRLMQTRWINVLLIELPVSPELQCYVSMPMKRNLRVTKWLGKIPAVGVCTFCDRLFAVPMTALKRVADAQESLRLQFAEHKCKKETGS